MTASSASIVNQNSNILQNAMSNLQANALSTLAALATSSDLISSPVASSPHPKASTGNVNGNARPAVNQESAATKARVSAALQSTVCFSSKNYTPETLL